MVLLVDDIVDLEEINLHLFVELVRNTCRADVRRTWLSLFAAHGAGLDNIRDIVNRSLGDSHLFQELLHGELRSMPPSDM